MWSATTVSDLRLRRASLTGSVAFVPTMGALHAGHGSLIERGRQIADHVIVSIFVNPTQFGPKEDFTRYPRPLKDDLALCERHGVAGVYLPEVAEMYPPGKLACEVSIPELAGILEGEHRPGHFAGVCRVVAKLLNMVSADVACFGKKDYQQLRIIEAMVDDLAIPVRIERCETKREPDGLAMSSRNRYLSDEQRKHALGLSTALQEARQLINDGETDPQAVSQAMKQVMQAHRVVVDYAEVRHAQTLLPVDCIEPGLAGGVVALVAGRVGDVRLIDNLELHA